MKTFAIDTNLLIYAHNTNSPLHQDAKAFIETVMQDQGEKTNVKICIPAQVLVEFISVATSHKNQYPLSISQASLIVKDYLNSGTPILTQKDTYLKNVMELLNEVTSRKQIFDVAIAAILKDNNVFGIYTVNVKDFDNFSFLEVINPLV